MEFELIERYVERELKWARTPSYTRKDVDGAMYRAMGAVDLYCDWYYEEYQTMCDSVIQKWADVWHKEFRKIRMEKER